MDKPNKIVSEKKRGKGVFFDRIRRITGYLSFLNQFNDGKKAEEKDRVKHSVLNYIASFNKK